jgi:acyl transferase domain-containing protein/NADP-dependent 3-hydroxy acid dehydrogenase YdfG/NAD(P)H-dependent flavin oxidoreductase YrpB (nitropropane dioxygenase family)
MVAPEQIVVSLCGTWDPSLPIAAARAGALGILDLTYLADPARARAAATALAQEARGRHGLLLGGRLAEAELAALEALTEIDTVLLAPPSADELPALVARARAAAKRVGLVATCEPEAKLAVDCQLDLIVVKGREAGGVVGEETTASLLARLTHWADMPLYAWGGISLDAATMDWATGVQGFVLDWQLALVRESPLSGAMRRCIEALDDRGTVAIRLPGNRQFRCLCHPRYRAWRELEGILAATPADVSPDRLHAILTQGIGKRREQDRLWPVAEDVAAARQLAAAAPSVSRALRLFQERLHPAEAAGEPAIVRAEPAPPPLDIAIIGIGCLLPGATDAESYWDNILAKRDLIQEIPRERFEADRWFDADPNARDKIYSKWGGFVPEIPFDPLKYGIPPAALRSIEPMQLMALELVARALGDAGYAEDNPLRARTSVVLGVGGGAAELGVGYGFRSMLPRFFENPEEALLSELPEWTEDSFAGILLNVVAGRVANRFDLGGVNFTVDAACASSLAAVYVACRELAAGTSDMVITGGCDTMQGPLGYLCFAKTGALSPRGRSRPFDANADGIAISEGHAAVVLKRRADAERDGDRIYAIIRAAAGGSDGRHKGLTAPRFEGQLQTLNRAYRQAGFPATTVGLFEAHGTGTAVGDQAECLALSALLEGAPPKSAALGSVKSMIGHTKCAAGVSGLIKAALALDRKTLPPTLHVERPNPKGRLDDGPLYVNSEARPWIRPLAHPRRAGVSAFGFGGSNFHVVLEEYCGDTRSRRQLRRELPAELFVFTAATRERLSAEVRGLQAELRAVLSAGGQFLLADLAYTAHLRQRDADGDWRAAVVATSASQLVDQLDALAAAVDETNGSALAAGVFYTKKPLAADAPLAFLFPGQGSQFPDMLRALAVEFDEVAACIERADMVIGPQFGFTPSSYIFPPPRFDARDKAADAERLKQTEIAQPALGACDAAVLRLLAAFDLEPAMVAGHSYGELVALHAAGCIDEQTLFELSAARGQAMAGDGQTNGGESGAMLAAAGAASQVDAVLRDCRDVWLANINSPRQTVISGTVAGIERAAKLLADAGIACQKLAVASAFHTPLMSDAACRFEAALCNRSIGAPRVPLYSNLTGALHSNSPDEIRRSLVDQITHQVRFREQIEAMYAAGARVFIEAGPGRVLSGLVNDTLSGRPHVSIPMCIRGGDGVVQLLLSLAELISHGARVNADRLYEDREVRVLDPRELAQKAVVGVPRHVWLLHGSGIRPAHEPPRPAPARGRFVLLEDLTNDNGANAAAEAAPQTRESDVRHNEIEQSRQGAGDMPASWTKQQEESTLNWPHTDSDLAAKAEVQLQFQQTMRQFLEVQRSVMLAYLGQADAATPLVEPVPRSLAMPPAVQAPPDSYQPASEPAPAAVGIGPQPVAAPPALDHRANGEQHKPLPPVRQPAAPATVSAATEMDGQSGLDARLLAIVSQRTGYPVEMLELEANLEADLGIDSIKRVEIISAFRREALPGMVEPPPMFMERMTAAKTMRSILDVVRDFSGQAQGESVAPHANGREALRPDPTQGQQPRLLPEQPPKCPRCLPLVVEAPRISARRNCMSGGVWFVTEDGQGIAAALSRTIAALGGQCVILPLETLHEQATVDEAIARVRTADGPIRGLLHVTPLRDAPEFPAISAQQWRELAQAEVKPLLYLFKALAPELRCDGQQPFCVVAATRGGGDFGPVAGQCRHAWRGGLAGICKTAAKEWPKALFRTIDFDELPDPAVLLEELDCDGPVEIGYRGGRRLTIQAVRAELPLADGGEPAGFIDRDDVVLVLAGAKGITAAIAGELAQRSGATMILVGRSPAPADTEDARTADCDDATELRRRVFALLQRESGQAPDRQQVEQRVQRLLSDREIRRTMREIAAAGSPVEYLTCDVRDGAALAALINDVQRRHGRIDVVVHGAGVIEDRYIVDKEPESFDRVVDTKVEPLLTLTGLLDPRQLKLLLLFSSVSGFFGNPGQMDYAAANEIVNRMARRLSDTWPARIIALNWGPWTGAGMVKPEVARQFEARGVGMVTVAAGREAAWREIVAGESDGVRILLGPGSWLDAADRNATNGHPVVVHTPLLARQQVRRISRDRIEAQLILDLDEHVFLSDHRIDGKPVLPLAFVLEFMVELAAAAEPRRAVAEVVDLRQLKGIVLSRKEQRLSVQGQWLGRKGGESRWRMRLLDPALATRALYEATICLSNRPSEAPPAPEFESLAGHFPLDVDEAYRRWLFHGPRLQAIDLYRGFDDTGVDVVIRASRPVDCLAGAKAGENWLIDPVMLDVGPQLAALWSRARTDTMLLPSRLDRYRRYAEVGADPLEVYFRVTKTDGHTVTADVWFVRDERVIGHMTQLESAGSRELNRITGGAWSDAV